MIYLDHNATTKVAPEVLEAIVNAYQTAWGNPSSSHSLGLEAKSQLESARQKLAKSIGMWLFLGNPLFLMDTMSNSALYLVICSSKGLSIGVNNRTLYGRKNKKMSEKLEKPQSKALKTWRNRAK